jgi:hypothetical protein
MPVACLCLLAPCGASGLILSEREVVMPNLCGAEAQSVTLRRHYLR